MLPFTERDDAMLCMYLAVIDEQTDRRFFETIYFDYRRQMFAVAIRILDNQEDAEDALQDALWRVARNLDAVRGQNRWSVRGYVLTVAKNSALKILKKNQRNQKALEALAAKPRNFEDLFEKVQNCMDHALLVHAMQQLPPLYRDVLLLVYVHNQSIREAADSLGRSQGTVRKQLARGKELLVELCRKEGLNYGQD